MRAAMALARAQWLTLLSYRAGMLFSFLSMAAAIIPVYFVANSLQPIVEESISNEGGNYFGFLVVGIAFTYMMSAALNALPTAIANGIRSGTFEALVATPTGTPSLFTGLAFFDILWAGLRATLVILSMLLFGGSLHLLGVPGASIAVLLTVFSYFGIGLIASSLILIFRTAGPLVQGVSLVSSLLGGVYYSTTVIPGIVKPLAAFVPLTYGMRVSRQSLLDGKSLTEVAPDLTALFGITLGLLAIGSIFTYLAFNHARKTGTIGQY